MNFENAQGTTKTVNYEAPKLSPLGSMQMFVLAKGDTPGDGADPDFKS